MVRPSYVRKLRFIDVGFWFVIMRYFVLLNNYVTLGLQKHVFLIKSHIRHFFVRSGGIWKVHHNYVASWFASLLYLFLLQNYVINVFLTMTYYVALRMEVTYGTMYGNYVSLLFVIVTSFLFRHKYIIYLFDVVTFFNDVRNRFFFGTFELRMEITLQLRFVFVRHCDVFFFTSKVCYLFVQCSSVF